MCSDFTLWYSGEFDVGRREKKKGKKSRDTQKGEPHRAALIAALTTTLTNIGYFASIRPVHPPPHTLNLLLSPTCPLPPSPSCVTWQDFHLPPSLHPSTQIRPLSVSWDSLRTPASTACSCCSTSKAAETSGEPPGKRERRIERLPCRNWRLLMNIEPLFSN